MGRIASSSPNLISSSAGGGGGTEDGLFLSLMNSPSMKSQGRGLPQATPTAAKGKSSRLVFAKMNVTTLSALASLDERTTVTCRGGFDRLHSGTDRGA